MAAPFWKYRSRSCASAAVHVTVRYELPRGCGIALLMAARDPELRDAPLMARPSATSHASEGRSTGMGIAAIGGIVPRVSRGGRLRIGYDPPPSPPHHHRREQVGRLELGEPMPDSTPTPSWPARRRAYCSAPSSLLDLCCPCARTDHIATNLTRSDGGINPRQTDGRMDCLG